MADEELRAQLEQTEQELRADRISLRSMGGAMANELVKSYGFRRNSETGQWDWSLGNIGEAFKEDPIWTSLDYATLLFAPARFGLAAASIARGAESAGVIGKGYRALKTGVGTAEELGAAQRALAGRSATSKLGRVFQTVTGQRELAAATEMKLAGASKLHGVKIPGTQSVWGLASPIDIQLSDEFMDLAGHFDREVWENRAILSVHQRERKLAENMWTRQAEDLSKEFSAAGLDAAGTQRFGELLRTKVTPGDVDRIAREAFPDNAAAAKAYKNTWGYRNTLHQRAYELGLISRETYEANLYQYSPRMYEEVERMRHAMGTLKAGEVRTFKDMMQRNKLPGKYVGPLDEGQAAGGATHMVSDRLASLQKKSGRNMEHLTDILDPRASLTRMAMTGQTIAREEFAQGIANSVLAVRPSEAVDHLLDMLQNRDAKRMLLFGITGKKLDAVESVIREGKAMKREITGEQLLEVAGWRQADELGQNIPEALKGVYLDPRTSHDITGVLKFMDDEPKWYANFYKNMIGTFRAGKTAYNPGTHVRNIFGGGIFAAMASGDFRAMIPVKGFQIWKERGEDLARAVKAGIVDGSFSQEVHEFLDKNVKLDAKTAIDWLPSNKVFDWMKRQAGKAENVYRTVDEIYKLEVFARAEERYKAIHGAGEVATSLATIDTNKFMPNFMMHSELTDFLRKGVPFASYTSEALRVWSNHLKEKPHMAYFANHMAQTMSEVFGAMAGFAPDQIEEAKQSLPKYMQGKKTLLLPFNIDGQPHFLDLSYVIPMGSLSEVESTEKAFFNAILDPTTNPVANIAAASATGKDPFSGREIAPNFTERQLGIPVTGPRTRRLLGLGEHMMQTLLPPWAPPGYAGVNILEAVRGQVNPATGEPLEDGVFRTVAGNLLGMRTYAPDVESQVKNVQQEQRELGEKISQAWKRWEFARANGKLQAMEDERQRIILLKAREGHDDPAGYFATSVKSREPFAQLSTKQLQKILDRAEKLGALSPRDERIRAELVSRFQSRKPKPKKDE